MTTLKKIWKQKELYLLVLPVLLYYLLFHYKPMYGLIIAFMDYSPRRGISGSDWVGLQHFICLPSSPLPPDKISTLFPILHTVEQGESLQGRGKFRGCPFRHRLRSAG